jgi:hypothetical protein
MSMYQIGADEPPWAGQRPNVEAELGETLCLSRGLRAEHPDLVPTLLQSGGDARDVSPNAAGAPGQ